MLSVAVSRLARCAFRKVTRLGLLVTGFYSMLANGGTISGSALTYTVPGSGCPLPPGQIFSFPLVKTSRGYTGTTSVFGVTVVATLAPVGVTGTFSVDLAVSGIATDTCASTISVNVRRRGRPTISLLA